MKTLIRNAHVLTLDAEDREYPRADILIDGDKIAAIGPDCCQADGATVIEASGKLAMPGLINGHFHSQASMLAGALANRPLELFMLFEVPPDGTSKPDPRLTYLTTMLGAMEMLKGGVTAVHDDAFHNPYPTPESCSRADAGLCGQRACARRSRSITRTSSSTRSCRSSTNCFRPRSAPRWTARRARARRRWRIFTAGSLRPGTAPKTDACASRYRTRRRSG